MLPLEPLSFLCLMMVRLLANVRFAAWHSLQGVLYIYHHVHQLEQMHLLSEQLFTSEFKIHRQLGQFRRMEHRRIHSCFSDEC